jgi:tetratricopeptide (TPR) repeat protein
MSILSRIGLGAILAVACVAGRAGEAPPSSTAVYGSWSFYNNMGWGAYYRGDLDLARDRFARAIEYIRPYQKEYPRLMSRSCHDLTRVLCAEGRFADAEPLARWVVEARDHDRRTRADVMFDSLYLLAVVYRETDRPADAVPVLRRAVALEEKCLGPGDARVALTLKELADVQAQSGALAEADASYRRAVAIQKRHAPMNLDLADALAARAEVLVKLGQAAHAKQLKDEADEILREAEGLPRLADHLTSPLAANPVRPGSR